MAQPISGDNSNKQKLVGLVILKHKKAKADLEATKDSLSNKNFKELTQEQFETLKEIEEEMLEKVEKELNEEKERIEKELKNVMQLP